MKEKSGFKLLKFICRSQTFKQDGSVFFFNKEDDRKRAFEQIKRVQLTDTFLINIQILV